MINTVKINNELYIELNQKNNETIISIINNNLKEVILWILNNGMALIRPENGQKK